MTAAAKPRMTLTALAWPLVLESSLRLLMGNVNVLMLSRYSDSAVGAVGVANQLIGMILVMYSIVATGTAITICQYTGAGRHTEAKKAASVALWANLAFGLLLSLPMLLFGDRLLGAMHLNRAMVAQASAYVAIVGGASFTQALMATMAAIARSYGHTKFPAYVALGMNVLNALGSYVAIFSPFGLPSYGVPGVAVSAVLSQLVGVAVMAVILKRQLGIALTPRSLRPMPLGVLKGIMRVGTPAAGEYMSYTAAQVAATAIVASLGPVAVTANVYVRNILLMVVVVGLSIGQATQILVGHLVGAGDSDAAYRTCFASLRAAAIANLAMSLTLFAFRHQVFALFTNDAAITSLGTTVLAIDVILEGGRVFNLVVMNSLRGSGDVRYPVVIGVASMWTLSVGLAWLLGVRLGLGLAGIWVAFAADEWFRGLAMLKRWRSGAWRSMALVKPEPCKG